MAKRRESIKEIALVLGVVGLVSGHAVDKVGKIRLGGGYSLPPPFPPALSSCAFYGVLRAMRLRGGGFPAVVPINRLLGRTVDSQKRGAKMQELNAKDAALLDAVNNLQDDDACSRITELLKGGASVNAQDPLSNCEYAALHFAASRGLTRAVQALVTAGAAVDTPAKHGQTALSLAAAKGYDETVECLLGVGALVSHKDMLGWTCLHQAAYYGSAAVVDRLIAAGADPRAKTKDGATPASLAQKNPLTPPCIAIAITDALSLARIGCFASGVGNASGGCEEESVEEIIVPIGQQEGETDADDSAKFELYKLGDSCPVMKRAIELGERAKQERDALLSSILDNTTRYPIASLPQHRRQEYAQLKQQQLDSILKMCEETRGTEAEERTMQRAMQMLQEVPTSAHATATCGDAAWHEGAEASQAPPRHHPPCHQPQQPPKLEDFLHIPAEPSWQGEGWDMGMGPVDRPCDLAMRPVHREAREAMGASRLTGGRACLEQQHQQQHQQQKPLHAAHATALEGSTSWSLLHVAKHRDTLREGHISCHTEAAISLADFTARSGMMGTAMDLSLDVREKGMEMRERGHAGSTESAVGAEEEEEAGIGVCVGTKPCLIVDVFVAKGVCEVN